MLRLKFSIVEFELCSEKQTWMMVQETKLNLPAIHVLRMHMAFLVSGWCLGKIIMDETSIVEHSSQLLKSGHIVSRVFCRVGSTNLLTGFMDARRICERLCPVQFGVWRERGGEIV